MKRALAALVLGLGCAPRYLAPSLEPTDRVPWTSADGWQGQLRHYAGPGQPVLLVHGMSANHYNFDYRPEVSLSDWLVGQGYDVWIASLRGDPGTTAPTKKASRNFTFDDFAELDIPANLDAVQAATGATTVYWVGHSMGGMLLYATLARAPERIAAGVAISSPARFDEVPPLQRDFARVGRALGRRGALPNEAMARWSAWMRGKNPAFRLIANVDNLDWSAAVGMARAGIVDLPRALVQQTVSWIRAGQLTRADGETPWLQAPDRAVPVLVLAGEADWLVPPANVAAACEILPDCTFRVLGPSGGQQVAYGHIDVVVGRTAREEVYPLVSDWLRAVASPPLALPHDAP